MDFTPLVAQLFGFTMLIVALAMLFRHKSMLLLIDDFLGNRAVLFLAAIISLMVGLLIILVHNVWSGSTLDIVVTLLGWILFLRGIGWMFVPSGVLRKLIHVTRREQVYFLIVVVVLIVGLYLTFAGLTS